MQQHRPHGGAYTSIALGQLDDEEQRSAKVYLRREGDCDNEFSDERKTLLANFVSTSLSFKECSAYVPATPPADLSSGIDNSRCCCGETDKWHEKSGAIKHPVVAAPPSSLSPSRSWSSGTNTREINGSSFGQISFVGFSGGNCRYWAPYARISDRIEPKVACDLLDKHWDLPPPKLLLSILGCSKFVPYSKPMEILKRQLVEAARVTGAWILTSGLRAGVSHYVGQAVHDYAPSAGSSDRNKIVLLGICPWGSVDGRRILEDCKGQGLFPALYDSAEMVGELGTTPLDNNHTHFLLVDDGTAFKFEREASWRAAFESYIALNVKIGVSKEHDVEVPAIRVMIAGGHGSLQASADGVSAGMPLIVVEGTGRAAEVVAYACRAARDMRWDADGITAFNDTSLPSRIKNEMGSCLQADLDNISRILAKINLVTILPLESLAAGCTMDRTIMQALMKAKQGEPRYHLSLALAWNKPDFLCTEILTTASSCQVLSGSNLHGPIFSSLVRNQFQFVQLFMDFGVDLRKFVTPLCLRSLYEEVFIMKDVDSYAEFIRILVDRAPKTVMHREDESRLLENIGRVIRMLIGNYYSNEYKGKRVKSGSKTSAPVHQGLQTSQLRQQSSTAASPVSQSGNIPQGLPKKRGHILGTRPANMSRRAAVKHLGSPEKHLLLWAILFNRRELAIIFWKTGNNHIASALIATRISRKLAQIADKEDMDDLIAGYQAMAETFGQLAVDMLAECYAANKHLTSTCLTREVPEWGHATAMNLAEDASHEDFMQHMSCQLKLSRIWKGNMVMYTPEWMLILTALMPLIFVPMLRFVRRNAKESRADEKEPEDKTRSQQIAAKLTASASTFNAAAGALALPSPQPQLQPPPSGEIGKGSTTPTGASAEAHVTGSAFAPMPRRPGQESRQHQQHLSKYYSVNLTGKGPYKISFIRALYYALTAPATKFIYNVMSYLCFMTIYSVFIITELRWVESAADVHVLECLTWVWCLSYALEEVRQATARQGVSAKYKVERWWRSSWNKLDLIMYALFLGAVVLRFQLQPHNFVYAHMAYVVSFGIFLMRAMQMFFVYKQIGPKIIMIQRMVKDLVFFIFIFVLFLFCYGISYVALLYPNSRLDRALLAKVIQEPYFIIFGEVPLDEIFNGVLEGCVANATSAQLDDGVQACPQTNWLSPIYLSLYCLVANVLLINLLVAMFSYTFQSVQDHSERLWKYNRYSLIHEFCDRPPLPCPLIVLAHVWRAINFLIGRLRGVALHEHNDFRIRLPKEDLQRVVAFERVAMNNLMSKLSNDKRKEHDSVSHSSSDGLGDAYAAALRSTPAGGDVLAARDPGLQQQLDCIWRRLSTQQELLANLASSMRKPAAVTNAGGATAFA